MPTTYEALTTVFVEDLKLEADEFTPDTHLVADLAFNSLAFRIARAGIRAHLGIALPDADMMNCVTVGDLADLIAEHHHDPAVSG
ncbi:phosphopantetheine-binding protein [Nocardia sp. NPDC051030]|uniref:acyl carrier protein n=1 Tax=Nocardia sp. NPDC051030 TaxID=3155162 RepID=UPI0034431FD0